MTESLSRTLPDNVPGKEFQLSIYYFEMEGRTTVDAGVTDYFGGNAVVDAKTLYEALKEYFERE